MPYARIESPSLALGLLKACLQESEIESAVLYPNLWFAEKIGIYKYKAISEGLADHFVGEWTFSGVAFPDFKPDYSEYFSGIFNNKTETIQLLCSIREQAVSFIEQVAQSVLDLQPRIVSCSSTFHQHCASLALLRRIRELEPQVITVMGGGNCEGPMGLVTHKAFPWVDFVCSGEGDDLFAKFCHRLLAQELDLASIALPYGVIGPSHRDKGLVASEAPRASVQDLDRIPIPDYDDYFQTLRSCPKTAPYISPGLFVETSRGCWWGQRQHCTFCGLNGQGMTYRSKSPERVVKEFTWLSQRYGLRKFFVVDNILDLRYMNTVLPMFAALEESYTIFYETKANLNRQQMQQLAEAGVRWLQPGIESMHNQALKLMNKGNIALVNVQLLKWAREFGIQVLWNFLVGMPGESRNFYTETLEWLPLIVHLQPPTEIRQVGYHRFSPYHERPEDYELRLLPHRAYCYIYPLSPEMLDDLAYYFEDVSDRENDCSKSGRDKRNIPEHQTLQEWVTEWKKLFGSEQPPILSVVDNDGQQLRIIDTRPCATKQELILEGLTYQVYVACDRALMYQELVKVLGKKYGLDVSWNDIEPVVKELRSAKVLLEVDSRLLSLGIGAFRTPIPQLQDIREQPGGYVDIKRYIQNTRKRFWE